ncbi:zinc finger protein, partial [Oryctes borbonicus]
MQYKATSLTLRDVQIFQNRKNLNDKISENIKVEVHDENIEVDIGIIKKRDLDILSCIKCSKTFEDEELFKIHNKECVIYKCNQCDRRTLTEAELRRHYRNHMLRKIYECELCNMKFYESQELSMHLLDKHPDKATTICNICYKIYSSVQILEKHRCVHVAREKYFSCKVCRKTFYTMSRLRLHADVHQKERYKCTICHRLFPLRSTLKRHIINQHYKEFACTICNFKCNSKSILKQHYETHSIENLHKCETCGKEFARRDTLVIHIKCVHDNINIYDNHMKRRMNSSETNRCTICSKTFKRLDKHVAHTHFSKHVCNICNRKCGSKSALSDHIRTHTGDRPYKCEFCGKGFAQRGTLGVHIQCAHKKEKPYVCETCGKAFTLKGSLTKHTIVHMSNLEKKFICEVADCNRSFRTKRDRHDHMRRHIKGRCHPCTLCDKAFFDSTGLKRHMKCHTGEKPYECSTCHKSFSQQSNLRIHYRSHR